MTRKRTNRKVWGLVDPICHAAYQASRLTVAEWNTQITPVIAAVDALSTGHWDAHENWQPMFEALIRIESMLKLKHMPSHGFIEQAKDVYTICLSRMDRTGVTAFKAEELAIIREVVQVYGDLLKEVSHGEFSKACAHAYANVDRVAGGKQKIRNEALLAA